MSPSADSQLNSEAGRSNRSISPATAAFALFLALGTAAVVWHARASANTERVRAQTEAMGHGAAVEIQFGPALRAADVLGALARQGGGAIPNFQKIAGDLHAAFPGLASLEMQPGGILSEIVPRANNERAIGLNVLNHSLYRASAMAALQSRTSTVAAPQILYSGEPGLIVRVPVFQTGRQGYSQFWGFIAVSMRLREALDRAGLSELSSKGYDYALYVADSAPGKSVTIAHRGIETLRDTVQQPIRLQNLEFRLALRRHGGWISKSMVLAESAGVVVASCVLFFLVNLAAGRRQSAESLAKVRGQLANETTERKRVQQELDNAKTGTRAELTKVQAALQQAQAEIGQQTQALRVATESRQAAEVALEQAQLSASELQARLDRTVQSGKDARAVAQADLTEAHARLKAAEQRVRELEGAAAKAGQVREVATTALQAEQAKADAAIVDLRNRLEIEKLAAEKAAGAGAIRLKEAEAANHELRVRLAEAERAQVRATELESLLQAKEAGPTPGADLITVPDPPAAPASTEGEPASSPLPGAYLEAARRRRIRRKDQNQIELFGPADPEVAHKPAPPRAVDVAQLRRAVNEILPLLTDKDPGAKDCFKANRSLFRSAFPAAGFEEFEQFVKNGAFEPALDKLTKAVRKHGITI